MKWLAISLLLYSAYLLLVVNTASVLDGAPASVSQVLEYRLLTHQIASVVESLQRDCPWANDSSAQTPFFPGDSHWWWGVGKRAILGTDADKHLMNIRLETGANLLQKLKEDYVNCMTSGRPTPAASAVSSTVALTTPAPTVPPYPHAFTVLRSAKAGIFTVLKVRFPQPVNGSVLSATENWCRDYQNLCEGMGMRPTGCANGGRGDFERCETDYNSKRDFLVNDPLGCDPSIGVRTMAWSYFRDPTIRYNASFAFNQCSRSKCAKTLAKSTDSLSLTFGVDKSGEAHTICYG